MPLKDPYGVLKGRPVAKRRASGSNTHFHIHLVDPRTDWRIAINCKSRLWPSEVEYIDVESFNHVITTELPGLPLGFTSLESKKGGLALDFIRMNLFDRTLLKALPFSQPGEDNDLNEKLDRHVQRAMDDEDALIYAFGGRWGPEPNTPDKIFGFRPGNGIHEIHMNQGNAPEFKPQDGIYQDGALLIHLPSESRWIGIFTKFQSQAWHTDDVTGHTIGTPPKPGEKPDPSEPDLVVRILAALVNPAGGGSTERETVTLLNTSPQVVDLAGWMIADRQKNKHPLSGTLQPGEVKTFSIADPVRLSNNGDIITLLNAEGLKVHGVSYTKEQARREGWTIVF